MDTRKNFSQDRPDVIVLFSGGLDSILAAKVLQEQGLVVRCLHCVSPFFGSTLAVPRWQQLYDLDITHLDVSADFAAMLRARPAHGFGKVMNPCIDCKILLLRHARLYMESAGARFLASGEVLGQRPMSQRRDTIHRISREAGVRDLLLRPLSARLLPPTAAEVSGLVDRERLHAISGRGRNDQLALARHYGLKEIPTPGGGCRLTERENARRYWPVLSWRNTAAEELAQDFALANLGRQFWREAAGEHYWLCIGRNDADNKKLAAAARAGDLLLSVQHLPGPLGLARGGAAWPADILKEAAALTASYAPKAAALGREVPMGIENAGDRQTVNVMPIRPEATWADPAWEEVREAIRQDMRSAFLHPPESNELS